MNGRQNALHYDRSANVYVRFLFNVRKVFILDNSTWHCWKAETISRQNTPFFKTLKQHWPLSIGYGGWNAIPHRQTCNVYVRTLLNVKKVFIVDTSTYHWSKAEPISRQNRPVTKDFEAPLTPLSCVRQLKVALAIYAIVIHRRAMFTFRFLLIVRKVFVLDNSSWHCWKDETISRQNKPVFKVLKHH